MAHRRTGRPTELCGRRVLALAHGRVPSSLDTIGVYQGALPEHSRSTHGQPPPAPVDAVRRRLEPLRVSSDERFLREQHLELVRHLRARACMPVVACLPACLRACSGACARQRTPRSTRRGARGGARTPSRSSAPRPHRICAPAGAVRPEYASARAREGPVRRVGFHACGRALKALRRGCGRADGARRAPPRVAPARKRVPPNRLACVARRTPRDRDRDCRVCVREPVHDQRGDAELVGPAERVDQHAVTTLVP
jgi:hypothetical protein